MAIELEESLKKYKETQKEKKQVQLSKAFASVFNVALNRYQFRKCVKICRNFLAKAKRPKETEIEINSIQKDMKFLVQLVASINKDLAKKRRKIFVSAKIKKMIGSLSANAKTVTVAKWNYDKVMVQLPLKGGGSFGSSISTTKFSPKWLYSQIISKNLKNRRDIFAAALFCFYYGLFSKSSELCKRSESKGMPKNVTKTLRQKLAFQKQKK